MIRSTRRAISTVAALVTMGSHIMVGMLENSNTTENANANAIAFEAAVAQNIIKSPMRDKNSIEKLRPIFKFYPDTIHATYKKNKTLLHVAIKSGSSFPLIRFLVEQGVDPDSKDSQGKTALDYAHENGNTKKTIITYLKLAQAFYQTLKNPAMFDAFAQTYLTTRYRVTYVRRLLDLDQQNEFSLNFVLYCKRRARITVGIFEILRDEDIDEKEKIENLKSMLVQDPNGVHVKNPFGLTALQYVCLANLPTVAAFLIKSGADINTCDCNGVTALHWAVYLGKQELVKTLLQTGSTHGLQIDKKTVHKKRTALAIALMEGYKVIAEELKKYGAKKIEPDNKWYLSTLCCPWTNSKKQRVFDTNRMFWSSKNDELENK